MEFDNIFEEIIMSMRKSLELNSICDLLLRKAPGDLLMNQFENVRNNLKELFPHHTTDEI